MKWYDRIGVAIGILGFLVSLWALKQSHDSLDLVRQRMNAKLVVRVDQALAQKDVTFSEYDSPRNYPVIYRQQYHVMINNIGYEPVAITRWQFRPKMPWQMPDTGKLGYGLYRGLDPHVSTASGNAVRLPLKIEPKEPLVVTLELGLRVPEAAWQAVSDTLETGVSYPYRTAKDEFAKAGYADFGQISHVKRDIESGVRVSSNGSEYYQQDIRMDITKGDGTQLSISIYPHVSARYVEVDDGRMVRRP